MAFFRSLLAMFLVFIASGVRMKDFECKRCGKCCEISCVRFLTVHDFNRIMDWLHHVENWGKKIDISTIEEYPGLYCFGPPSPCAQYDSEKKECKIYEARPDMCREYPNDFHASWFSSRKALEICSEFRG